MRRALLIAIAGLGSLGVATAYLVASRQAQSLQNEFAKRREYLAHVKLVEAARAQSLRDAAQKAEAASVRLVDLHYLSSRDREAVRAVQKALAAQGLTPSEYFASIEERGHTLVFDLRHDHHLVDFSELGDGCGKCRTAVFDLDWRTIRIFGVR